MRNSLVQDRLTIAIVSNGIIEWEPGICTTGESHEVRLSITVEFEQSSTNHTAKQGHKTIQDNLNDKRDMLAYSDVD
jgi:hypothetical protein